MDSIRVTVPCQLSAETVRRFMERQRADLIESPIGVHWSLVRGDAAVDVYADAALGAENRSAGHSGSGAIDLVVSRREGSLWLAFDLAHTMIDTWGGTLCCGRVPGWDDEHSTWLAAHGKG
jgi:hypothetical protein